MSLGDVDLALHKATGRAWGMDVCQVTAVPCLHSLFAEANTLSVNMQDQVVLALCSGTIIGGHDAFAHALGSYSRAFPM
jgi:nitrate/nitrite transporter NarK